MDERQVTKEIMEVLCKQIEDSLNEGAIRVFTDESEDYFKHLVRITAKEYTNTLMVCLFGKKGD
jgi:hypothetical protein